MQQLERLRMLGGGEFLSNMVRLFISHAEPVMRDAVRALASDDLDGVRRAAHSLRSSAGNLGACQVQEIAGRIEHLAEDHKAEEIQPLMTELESALIRAKDQLVGETT